MSLDRLLDKTSRTFALSIPLLPDRVRRQVTTAYLLFRIADTFEDAVEWDGPRRARALEEFSRLLGERDDARAATMAKRWRRPPPVAHAGYLELLDAAPEVLAAFWDLDDPARRTIAEHLRRTAERMSGFVMRAREGGCLTLRGLDDLRAYCYAVAGIVGEMLTELFLLDGPRLAEVGHELRQRAPSFGEGLQLVNILKDSATDRFEGRCYIPGAVSRSTVFALARADLARAGEYVGLAQRAGADRGVVAFNALPVLLARATLDRVERSGPGSKLTRGEVFSLLEQLHGALDRGEPAVDEVTAAPR